MDQRARRLLKVEGGRGSNLPAKFTTSAIYTGKYQIHDRVIIIGYYQTYVNCHSTLNVRSEHFTLLDFANPKAPLSGYFPVFGSCARA